MKILLHSLTDQGYGSEPTPDVQLAVWSPKGHSLAVVYRNDLYYVADVDKQGDKAVKLTHDGREGVVFNGIPDWLYEGESYIFLRFI